MGEESMELNGMDIPAEVQRSGLQGPGGSRDALCAQIRSESGEFLQGEFISPVAIKNEGPPPKPSEAGSVGREIPGFRSLPQSPAATAPSSEGAYGEREPSASGPKEPAPAPAEDPRLDEVRRFAAHFPGVQGEDVPPEVWDMVRGGLPLTAAYAIHQNRALRFELETLKQNAAARERSTGSMTGLGERHTDPLDEGWYDD